MALLPKRRDTVVVDELLAFVQNKLDVMDVVSLEQICLTSYSDVDIYTAMAHLNETAEPKHVRLTMRNKEGSGKKNIRDIFRVFQNEDPDDVPTYVARDLNKLPPVTFDHVDVTTLLKDIVLLKSDVKELKEKWDTAEHVSAELRRELAALRGQNAASATPPAACVNMQRGVAAVQLETAPVSDSTRPATEQQPDKLRVSDPAADRKSDNNTLPPPPPRPEPALHPNAAPFVPGRQKEVPPQKTRRPRRKRQPAPPVTQNGKQKASPAAKEDNVASKAIAAEPITQLYVSRLDCNTTPEDILQHVNRMCQLRQDLPAIPADSTVEIRQLGSKVATNFRSFVLSVPRKFVCKFMRENFWPQGVVFRRYRPPVQRESLPPPPPSAKVPT
ncbi:hypothetical protein NE865_04269 [Phthorimaea operculella]|nr:hypothetical protein NE865_04269 [Phthorimaea operculella]